MLYIDIRKIFFNIKPTDMKTLNYVYGLSLLFFSIVLFAYKPITNDCDPITLSKEYQMANNLETLRKNDTTSMYTFKIMPLNEEKPLIFFYEGRKLADYEYNPRTDTKICTIDTTTNKKILEIVLGYDQGTKKKSFFFVNGIEIKTFLPEMPINPFRVKKSQNKIIFCFEDQKTNPVAYASYDLKTGEFCNAKQE